MFPNQCLPRCRKLRDDLTISLQSGGQSGIQKLLRGPAHGSSTVHHQPQPSSGSSFDLMRENIVNNHRP